MTSDALAIELTAALNLTNTEWQKSRLFNRRPLERDRIVSTLAHAVGDNDLKYLQAFLDEPRDVGTGATVVAFTERLVAIVRYSTTRLHADILPRSSLNGIRILRAPNLLGGGGSDKLILELEYAHMLGSQPITLGHKHQTPENVGALRKFFTDLQRDLS